MEITLITGTPDRVFEYVYDVVDKISKHRGICQFYVGRTNDLNATYSRHGCEEIIPIYRTESIRNAAAIEDELIKSFHAHHKCNNNASHSGGNWSGDYIQWVYVALWFNNN